MAVIATAALLSLIVLVLCLSGLRAPSSRRYVFLSVLFVFVYTTATDLRRIFPWIPDLPGHYNWTGKVLELLVCLIAVYFIDPSSRLELSGAWDNPNLQSRNWDRCTQVSRARARGRNPSALFLDSRPGTHVRRPFLSTYCSGTDRRACFSRNSYGPS